MILYVKHRPHGFEDQTRLVMPARVIRISLCSATVTILRKKRLKLRRECTAIFMVLK